MALRTNVRLVKDILLRDYDLRNEPNLMPFIRSAAHIVDRMIICATAKGFTISDDLATDIHTWLSAYRYSLNNPVYSSKSTDGRSASFLREGNPYKQGAIELDPSGCLAALLDPNKQRIGFSWLGKRPSESIPFDERD